MSGVKPDSLAFRRMSFNMSGVKPACLGRLAPLESWESLELFEFFEPFLPLPFLSSVLEFSLEEESSGELESPGGGGGGTGVEGLDGGGGPDGGGGGGESFG